LGRVLKDFSEGIPGSKVSLWLLELRPLDGVSPFWLDPHLQSSMSRASFELLVPWMSGFFDKQAGDFVFSPGLAFSSSGSLLAGLYGNASRRELVQGVKSLSDLVLGLVEEGNAAQVGIDRSHWERSCALDSWTWAKEFFFLIDADPFSGPERVAYVVAVRVEQAE
jgi:hypothetical protein